VGANQIDDELGNHDNDHLRRSVGVMRRECFRRGQPDPAGTDDSEGHCRTNVGFEEIKGERVPERKHLRNDPENDSLDTHRSGRADALDRRASRRMSALSPPPADLLGPGRLVLIVGPSGAGKDAVLAAAKAASADDETIVFPRRLVTRAADAHEDHDSISENEFRRLRDGGAFVLLWEAHGLKYGIPRSVDDDIRAGRTIVCNVSRGVVDDARAKYGKLTCVQITAPAEMLAERIARRARTTDGSTEQRIDRTRLYSAFQPDFEIVNGGLLPDAVNTLVSLLRSSRRHNSN